MNIICSHNAAGPEFPATLAQTLDHNAVISRVHQVSPLCLIGGMPYYKGSTATTEQNAPV